MTATSGQADALETKLLEAREANLKRLGILLRLVEGAWAVAVYEDARVRSELIAQLRARLDPIPVLEIPLTGQANDPLEHLRRTPFADDATAPVMCFTSLGTSLEAIGALLDAERESLARYPHRIVVWLSPAELKRFALLAANFFSRISGTFDFPGRGFGQVNADRAVASAEPSRVGSPSNTFFESGYRPRLQVPARDRAQRIESLEQRIKALEHLKPVDQRALGDAWFDRAGLYEQVTPPEWGEAEVAYAQAALKFRTLSDPGAEAEALFMSGMAASRGYAHDAALESYEHALKLFKEVGDRLGEANTIAAKGLLEFARNHPNDAENLMREALRIFERISDQYSIGKTLFNHAAALANSGHAQAPMYFIEAALEFDKSPHLKSFADQARQTAQQITASPKDR